MHFSICARARGQVRACGPRTLGVDSRLATPHHAWREAMEGQPDDQNQDLTVFVQNLLKEMQGRFQHMSDAIVNRIDDMGSRIDDLERSISELIREAGVEEGAAAPPPAQR